MSDSRGAAANDNDEEWAISLDDLGDDGERPPEREPIEPGSPTIEGVAFVVLGVALTLAVVFAGL